MKTLVTANVDERTRQRLEDDLGLDIDYRPIAERQGRFPPDELVDLLDGVEVFIVGFEGVSEDILDAAEDLRILACTRGGPDANIDIEAATERGIPVLYAPGRNAVSVADFTIGLILAVTRNIAHSHHLLHTGTHTGEPSADSASGGEREDVTWGIAKGSPYVELSGPELEGKTVGLVGVGAIGRKVAERAAGFDVELIGHDPYVDAEEMAEYGVEKVDLDTLCERSDVVTVHATVTDETRGLIGADQFEAMSASTFFINTARGAVIDQEALVAQLAAGELAGAALDVYDEEPLPDDHELLAMDNVVTTPHLAGAADEVVDRHSQMVYDGLVALFDDEVPDYIANESVLSGSEE